MGITGKKFQIYPSVIATLNTDVYDFYVRAIVRDSDDQINIIFNKAYSGSFILGLSFLIEDA